MQKKFLAVSFIVIGIFLASAVISSAHAALPSGTINFAVKVTANEKGAVSKTFTATMHIKALDTTTGTVSGYCPATVSGDGPMIMSGNYILIGTILYINLSVTQKHNTAWRDAGVMQIAFTDPTTLLKGTFFQTRTDFNISTKAFENGFASGTIAKK